MEVSALKYRSHLPAAGLRGPTPLLRLQSDERLVALTRRGNQAAYEALVARYQSRLLAFCRHMLASREDAEDVLQEVFAAAFNAMTADGRPINVRPWLYRIARNRCLNHLRRQTAIGVDSMDVHLAEHGTTTADKVHDREQFRELVADVQTLAETQRTALLLREIDALSYEQIAEAMETTVPAVKSLLVRARVALAEAAEARQLTCDDVRGELGEWAEGLRRVGAPGRRHIRACEDCASFKKQLTQTNKALAALFPVGPLLLLKNLVLAHGAGGAAAGGTAAATGTTAVGGATASGVLTAGVSAVATKAAAGLAVAAIVTTGAVEADRVTHHRGQPAAVAAKVVAAPARVAPVAPAPVVVHSEPQPAPIAHERSTATLEAKGHEAAAPASASTATPSTAVPVDPAAVAPDPAAPVQQGFDNTQLPPQPPVDPAPTPAAAVPPAEVAPAAVAPQAAVPTGPAPAVPSAQTTPAVTKPTGPATTPPPAVTPVPADPAPAADPPAGPSATTPAVPATPVASSATPATPVASSATPATPVP